MITHKIQKGKPGSVARNAVSMNRNEIADTYPLLWTHFDPKQFCDKNYL